MVKVPRIALDTTDATIERYDPLEAPDPQQWLALDESERIDLVEDYHRDAGIRLPNLKVHATLHAVVENQIALGDELPVKRALHRLMAEGLDRQASTKRAAGPKPMFGTSRGRRMCRPSIHSKASAATTRARAVAARNSRSAA